MVRSSRAVARAPAAPCLNCNFLVDLGRRDPRDPAAGFSEVRLPGFPAGPRDETPAPRTLVLRRGFDGTPDLVDWWNEARRGKAAAKRSVAVHLLAADHATVVLSWRFRNARPVALAYSPLSATEPAVLIETIELEFEAVEILGAGAGPPASATPRAGRSRARARS